MSRLFKALERAEQEGTLQRQTWSWDEVPLTAMPGEPEIQSPPPSVEPPVAPRVQTSLPRGIDPHLVALLDPAAFEAEPYRVLSHLLEQMRRDNGWRVVAISSPAAGDGKTTTVLNLAGMLSLSPSAKVLLLEAELRRPSVATYLGWGRAGGQGLADALLEPELAIQDVIRPYPPFNLDIMPAGRPLASPYDLLKAPRLQEIINEARQHYDWILIDAPPLVPFADCRIIEQWVDSILVVIAAHKTPQKLIEEALEVPDPAKIAGLVFNRDEHLAPGYHAYNHYLPPTNGYDGGRRFFRRRKAGRRS